MKLSNKRPLAVAIMLCGLVFGPLFAAAADLAKQADGLVRSAERMMFNGKNEVADKTLGEALKLIEQVKSEDPANKLILRVEKKYTRVRNGLDKKIKKPVASVSGNAGGPPAIAAPSGNAKLPGGVAKRLRDINRTLDDVERGSTYRLDDVRELFAEIDRMYGGKFDPAHPDYTGAKDRFDKLATATAQAADEKAKREAEAQATAKALDAEASEWIAKFQAYLSYPGNEGHNPDKLVFVPGTSEPEKFEDAQRRYHEFKKFYDDFKKIGFPYGNNWKLADLVDNQAPIRLQDFETGFAQRQASAEGDVRSQIDSAMSQLHKDNGWKGSKTIKPLLVDRNRMESIRQQVERAATALGQDSEKARGLRQAYADLVAEDQKNRETRKQRTYMEPDKYGGSDIGAIKEKAAALVAGNAKEGGTPLRTTVISEDWREESVWEWTDTSRTQRRYRTTRHLTAQVAARTADGVRLITVAIAKDKQSDGSWGALYGNLHQYSDPMLEENVHENPPK